MQSMVESPSREFVGVEMPEDFRSSTSLDKSLKPKWKLFSSCVLGLALQCGWYASGQIHYSDKCRYAWQAGSIFGSLISGFSTDVLGRKGVLVLSCVPMVIGAAVEASASAGSQLQFAISSLIAGIASGAVTGVLSTYISEVSPPHLRSSLGVIVQGGIFLSNLLVTTMDSSDPNYLSSVAAIPATFGVVVFVLALFVMVESPVFLLLRGRRREAVTVMVELYGEDQAQTALERIEIPEEDVGAFGLPYSRLCSRGHVRPFVLVIGLAVVQPPCSNLILEYNINRAMGGHTAILWVISFCVCLVIAVLVRWVGNRILQLVGVLGALTAAAIAAVEFREDNYPKVSAVACFTLFRCTFATLAWVVMADVCTNRGRAKTVSIGVSLMWATDLVVSITIDANLSEPGVYIAIPIIFGVILLFVLFAVPNTTGKTTAEVQRELAKPMEDITRALGTIFSCSYHGSRDHSDDDKENDDDDDETRSTRPMPPTTSKSKLTVATGSVWTDPELLRVQVRLKSIKDIKLIGSGGYGVVYLVWYRNSQLLASKRLRPGAVTRQITQKFVEEIKLVAKLDHTNIVNFVGAAWSIEADLQALFEYMERGDLRMYLTDPSTPYNWTATKFQIAIDVVEALVYVHSFSPPLVHRDLKSRNVLISSDMRAKLTDFGVSRYQSQDNTMTVGIGTSRWLAPEVINGSNDYGPAADVFSFGVVLSELDTHQIPYEDAVGNSGNPLPEVAIVQRVAIGSLTPAFSQSCPPQLLELAQRCMSFNPKDRPTAPEIAYVLRTVKRKVVAT